MKEFNLTEYLKNPSQKVVTRDGRDVRIICTDFKSQMDKPIIAIMKEDENKESVWNFSKNGKYHLPENKESSKDLFFAPTKIERWINIYKDKDITYLPGIIHDSEKEAKEAIKGDPEFIATIKIEWEED